MPNSDAWLRLFSFLFPWRTKNTKRKAEFAICPLGTERVHGIRTVGKYTDLVSERQYHEDPDGEHQYQRGGEQNRDLAAGERRERENETSETDQVRVVNHRQNWAKRNLINQADI